MKNEICHECQVGESFCPAACEERNAPPPGKPWVRTHEWLVQNCIRYIDEHRRIKNED